MFGKRCTLCGGKLDSNGICKECGLDNKKNDKNYRVNQSSFPGTRLLAAERRPARLRVTGRRSISRLPAADRRCERNGDASDGSASSSW